MTAEVCLLDLTARLLRHADSTVATVPGQATRTYRQLHDDVKRLAARLGGAGLRPGMRVGVWMANSYEWLVADLSLLELRCISVALPVEAAQDGLAAEVKRLGLHAVLCDPGDAPDETWAWRGGGDGAGFAPRAVPFEERTDLAVPAWTFSSGTTGRLRCIETDRRGVEALVSIIGETFRVDDQDRFLLFLPMHSFQQRFLLYATLWHGVHVTITEPRHLLTAMVAAGPTLLIAPPSLFEAMARRVTALPPRQRWALRVGLGLARLLPAGLASRLRRALGRPLREALGGRTRLLISGMAPISESALATFERLGMPITEVYGMTECGMIAWNTASERRLGAVGRPLRDARVTLGDDGEVLVQRSAQPTRRYLFEDEAADGTYRGDGLIATGDLGRLDADGYLYLTGRKKNIVVTATGEKLSPEPLEAELRAIPSVDHAVFVQRGGRLAVVCRVDAGADAAAVTRAVSARLQDARNGLSAAEVVVTAEPFTVASGIITANLKVRRDALAARFFDGQLPAHAGGGAP